MRGLAYESPQPSMSRIRQAICARLAASATRLKSRRNVSVPDCLACWGGWGGTKACEGDDCEAVDEAAELLAPPWRAAMGDEMGAFMFALSEWILDLLV